MKEGDEQIVRITFPGVVPTEPEKLNNILAKIASPKRISEATKEELRLAVPLGGQKIELEHSKLRRGEIFLLNVKKYIHKQT